MSTDRDPARDLAARFHAAAPVLAADPAALVARGRRRRRTVRTATTALTVVAVAAVATAAVGLLGGPDGGGTPPAGDTPPPGSSDPVSLWISAERVAPGDADLVAVLVSNDGTEATFGVYAELERWDGDSWVPTRHAGLCLAEWHCSARMQPLADDLAIEDIGLWVDAATPGPVERFTVEGLDPGWYRLSQESADGVVAHGVFEIAENAPEATPLWPVDSPAVSVQPPLLPTEGGEVALIPLVPPVDGTLDAGMLEGAMAGLDDVALVQRWGPDGWADVAEVATSPPDAVSVPGELRAALPALEPGAYRVLLRGNGKELMGSVWVPGEIPAPTAPPTPSSADPPDDGTQPPCYDMPDVLCAMDLWLVESIVAAGYETAGGEHDIGAVATDTVLVGDSVVSAAVWPLDADVAPGFASSRTTTVGTLTVEHSTADGHGPESRFTCGGFRLALSISADTADAGSAQMVADVAGAVAAEIGPCPADEAALVAAYSEEMG